MPQGPDMLWKVARKAYRALLGRFAGRLRIEPHEDLYPVDVRETTNHWSSLLYRTDFQPVVIEASLQRSVDVGGVSFGDKKVHPYVRAASRGLDSVDSRAVLREKLERYCECFEDRDARFGLPHPGTPLPGEDGVDGAVFPWAELDGNDGDHRVAGPDRVRRTGPDAFSESGLERWVERFDALVKEVRMKRSLRIEVPAEPIPAVGLIDSQGGWRWMPAGDRDQRRRVAAYSVLGLGRVPIRIDRVARRDDVGRWPGVVDGPYSEFEALAMFNHLLYRVPTPALRTWLDGGDGPTEPAPDAASVAELNPGQTPRRADDR